MEHNCAVDITLRRENNFYHTIVHQFTQLNKNYKCTSCQPLQQPKHSPIIILSTGMESDNHSKTVFANISLNILLYKVVWNVEISGYMQMTILYIYIYIYT